LVLFAIITNNQEIELYAQDLSDKLDEDVMEKYEKFEKRLLS
jgi:hypothetical protein